MLLAHILGVPVEELFSACTSGMVTALLFALLAVIERTHASQR